MILSRNNRSKWIKFSIKKNKISIKKKKKKIFHIKLAKRDFRKIIFKIMNNH